MPSEAPNNLIENMFVIPPFSHNASNKRKYWVIWRGAAERAVHLGGRKHFRKFQYLRRNSGCGWKFRGRRIT